PPVVIPSPFFSILLLPLFSVSFPYTTLFRSRRHCRRHHRRAAAAAGGQQRGRAQRGQQPAAQAGLHEHASASVDPGRGRRFIARSEEHTSELQSREKLVCRLLLEKKKKR